MDYLVSLGFVCVMNFFFVLCTDRYGVFTFAFSATLLLVWTSSNASCRHTMDTTALAALAMFLSMRCLRDALCLTVELKERKD